MPLGDAIRLRGIASASMVGPESISTALPQDGQNRAAPDISLPQAGQLIGRRASIPPPASKRGHCSAITPGNVLHVDRNHAKLARSQLWKASSSIASALPETRSRFNAPFAIWHRCRRLSKFPICVSKSFSAPRQSASDRPSQFASRNFLAVLQ